MARTLPTLDGIKVASPCNASWDDMAGDARVRFCGSCAKNVFNLSNMAREDAEALVQQAEGRVCVRFYRRKDGTVMTQDCPVGLAAVRRRLAWIGSAVAAGLSLVAAFVGLRPARASEGPIMGDVVAPQVMGKMMPAQGEVAPPPTTPAIMGRMIAPAEPFEMGDMVAPVTSAD